MSTYNETMTEAEKVVIILRVRSTVDVLLTMIAAACFLYGLTSWFIMRKFRHFKNFVHLNAVWSCLLRSSLSMLIGSSNLIFMRVIFFAFVTPYYWLLVIYYLIYADYVKVFNLNIKKKFIKCSLFAWGVPLVTCALFTIVLPLIVGNSMTNKQLALYINFYINMIPLILPLILNLWLYIDVVCSVCRESKDSSVEMQGVKTVENPVQNTNENSAGNVKEIVTGSSANTAVDSEDNSAGELPGVAKEDAIESNTENPVSVERNAVGKISNQAANIIRNILRSDVTRRLLIATLIFILGEIILIPGFFISFLVPGEFMLNVFIIITLCIQALLINIYLPFIKGNTELWSGVIKNML